MLDDSILKFDYLMSDYSRQRNNGQSLDDSLYWLRNCRALDADRKHGLVSERARGILGSIRSGNCCYCRAGIGKRPSNGRATVRKTFRMSHLKNSLRYVSNTRVYW